MGRQLMTLTVGLIAGAALCLEAQPPAPPLPPAKKFEEPSVACEAVLRLSHSTVARGGSFTIECQTRSIRGSESFFNCFLWEEYQLPAQIVITSADGQSRWELLKHIDGQSGGRRPRAWFSRGGAPYGREFVVRVGTDGGAEERRSPRFRSLDLLPGDYYIQAIYNRWLSPIRPNQKPGQGNRLPRDDDQPELFSTWIAGGVARPIAISEPVKFSVSAEPATLEALVRPSDTAPLHVELRPKRIEAIFGRPTGVEAMIVNRSDETIEVYTPTLGYGWGLCPAMLAILDEDGSYIGNLLQLSGFVSIRSPDRLSWVNMPPGGAVWNRISFQTGIDPDRGFFRRGIPPGKYLLELRVFRSFISGRPEPVPSDGPARNGVQHEGEDDPGGPPRMSLEEWHRSFPGPEICRSNRVELEILPRTGD